MTRAERARVLEIVATDNTFAVAEVRGERCWVGKCLHCGSRLVAGADSALSGGATIEHIVPRAHGGSDAIENLALACASCNHEKGRRHDARRKARARADEVVQALRARRRARWRQPEE